MTDIENNGYILVTKNITKRYGSAEVLKNVNFALKKGEVHSLLGANGAGKSTLMKALDGVIAGYEGEIYVHGQHVRITSPEIASKLGIGMVHQELSVLPNISVAENIYINRLPKNKFGIVNWKKLYRDSATVLNSIGMEINPRMLLGKLSVADRQMVEIARIISMNMPIILLDEPTSALSEFEIQRLIELIKRFKNEGRSVVFITHKLDEILCVSDRITVLRDGSLVDTIDVTGRDKKAERELVSLMIGQSTDDLAEIFPPKGKDFGDTTIEVKNLSREGVFEDISFYARKGEVVVITGLKGAKRTEVMRAVFGADKFTNGEIQIKGNKIAAASIRNSIRNGVAMVTEDRKGEGLVASMSVKENVSLATIEDCSKAYFINRNEMSKKAKRFVELLQIKVPSINVLMSALSGGNQQKIVISKWLAAVPDILILDEPTRGIDINSKIELYSLIREMANNGNTVLVVSSEIPEAMGLADRLYVMREGRMIGEISGQEIKNDVIMHMMFGHSKC